MNLSYTGDSLVREMDDPSSGHHYYRYTNGRLTQYEAPNGATTGYRYNSAGRLDKITEPGGTTVELDTTAGGRVSSITTTLPGGVPQTTSFVYTRRPYKTDVTGPDSVRRTYAYDDDWRVTRQYNPDVKPTVTASGELRDLADGYVGPNRTYPATVSATEPDGAGLRRLAVDLESGSELAGENVPCASTSFDLVCPTSYSATVNASFASVPEGRQGIHATATDDEANRGVTGTWTVFVDKTAPVAPGDLQLSYFAEDDPTQSATITWQPATDPDLAPDLAGSGVTLTEVRYRINNGTLSPWEEAGDGEFAFTGGTSGDNVEVQVRATDAVGNVSQTTSETITLSNRLEDPEVSEMAAEYFAETYNTSLPVAREWMEVQDKTEDLGAEVSQALPDPGGYAGVWFDNQSRRLKVALTTGTSHSSTNQVLVDRGLTAQTDIVETQHTQRQLEVAQEPMEGEIMDLIDDGLVTVSRNVSENRLDVEVVSGLSTSQRARVDQAAAQAAVTATVIPRTKTSFDIKPMRCKFPYCDGSLRGGVGIGVANRNGNGYGRGCTAGFIARNRANDGPRLMTAGHCTYGTQLYSWFSSRPENGGLLYIGYVNDEGIVYRNAGDAGLITIPSDDSDYRAAKFRRPVISMWKSRTGSTSRDVNYDIRGVSGSVKGRIVCTSGSTNGSRCMTIEAGNQTVTYEKDDDLGLPRRTIKHLGRAATCGVARGDSGAPVVKNHRAYGIISGGADDTSCKAYYQGAGGAQDLLSANIATRR